MKKCAIFGREDGFWSAFVFIFLVTLAMLGIGSYTLVRSEGSNVSNDVRAVQAEYAANGAAFFGMKALWQGNFDSQLEESGLNIGNCTVTLDTSLDVSGSVWLTITATRGKAERQIQILIDPGLGFKDKAIVTTGIVSKVVALDENRVEDPKKLVSKADSIPTIKEDSLKAIAVAQGHKKVGNLIGTNNYPEKSFYSSVDGVTPNVTWVTGNFQLNGNTSVYCIFIVEGDVTINGTDRIYGTVYLPNEKSTIIRGGGTPGESTILGSIVSHGNITGKGAHITVQYDPVYMGEFCEFMKYPDSLIPQVVRWIYT